MQGPQVSSPQDALGYGSHVSVKRVTSQATRQPACRLAHALPAALAARPNGIANGPHFLRTHCHPVQAHPWPLCRLVRYGWQDKNKPVSLGYTVALAAPSSQPAAHIAHAFYDDHLRYPAR